MSDVLFSESIDRIRRRIEAGIILVEQRFHYHVDALSDAVAMLEVLISQERARESAEHEANRKRAPQKKRPVGTFARDVPAASQNIEVQKRDIETGERPYPSAAIRNLIANGVIAAGAGEDRAACNREDKGGTQ